MKTKKSHYLSDTKAARLHNGGNFDLYYVIQYHGISEGDFVNFNQILI